MNVDSDSFGAVRGDADEADAFSVAGASGLGSRLMTLARWRSGCSGGCMAGVGQSDRHTSARTPSTSSPTHTHTNNRTEHNPPEVDVSSPAPEKSGNSETVESVLA